MSDAHQFLARVVVAATIAMLLASLWSVISARRSDGRVDHRFAVDRLLLLVVGLIAVNGIAGLLLLAGGSRPADALHLLYGPAALVTLPIGVWLSRRGRRLARGAASRRDGWLVAAVLVLLGLELRLFMTG
jgi:4-hydroxybenzoate polyprenyltransferase